MLAELSCVVMAIVILPLVEALGRDENNGSEEKGEEDDAYCPIDYHCGWWLRQDATRRAGDVWFKPFKQKEFRILSLEAAFQRPSPKVD